MKTKPSLTVGLLTLTYRSVRRDRRLRRFVINDGLVGQDLKFLADVQVIVRMKDDG